MEHVNLHINCILRQFQGQLFNAQKEYRVNGHLDDELNKAVFTSERVLHEQLTAAQKEKATLERFKIQQNNEENYFEEEAERKDTTEESLNVDQRTTKNHLGYSGLKREIEKTIELLEAFKNSGTKKEHDSDARMETSTYDKDDGLPCKFFHCTSWSTHFC